MISLREYMIMFGEKSGVFNKISSFIVSFNRSTSFDRWKKFEDASSIGVCFLHFFNCFFCNRIFTPKEQASLTSRL